MNNAINGKRRALRIGTGIATCVSSIVLAQAAFGQAVLPEIVAMDPNVSTVGNVMTVDARGLDKVINWQTFSVAANNNVNFVSTDGMGAADPAAVTVINRVVGKDVMGTTTFFPSVINGRLNATSNIAVWLINPSGVLFGPSGSFNGGSLVVSTLDFTSGTGSQVFGASTNTPLSSRTVTIDDTLANLGAVEVRLDAGLGGINAGSVLLVGEQVTVGKTIQSAGDVFIVAASDVRVQAQNGSPVNFSIAAGTTLSGVQVLGSANVQGRSIVVAASNGTNMMNNLLQTASGSTLTATADGGGVTLLTTAVPAGSEDANIVSQGQLRTLGLGGNISVTSNADVTVSRAIATGNITVNSGAGATDTLSAGTIQAGGDVDLRSTGDMTLGSAVSESIQADGKVTIRSTGAIARGGAGGLSIRSHIDSALADGAMLITASGDANLGNAALVAGTTGTAPITVTSSTGAVTLGSALGGRFISTAATAFTSTAGITVDTPSTPIAGVALSISAPGGISLDTARTIGTDQDIALTTTGALSATTVTAARNLTIGNSGVAASTVNAGALTATAGNLGVNAGDITIGTALAGQNVTLRADGDIEVTTSGTAGNDMATGSFSAAGRTIARSASFTGGTIVSRAGTVSIAADAQTISSVRATGAATLTGNVATGANDDITLGSADVGGALTVSTAGDIQLGTAGAQSIVADGRVMITSSAGAISQGGSSLLIRSNDGDVTPADALTIRANGAVTLANTSLNGGLTGSAPVSVISDTASVTIGSARGSSFTGTAVTNFTANGSILADSPTAALGGNTINITGPNGISVQTVRTDGLGENIVLTSTGPITATTLDARRNLNIASLANPASSLSATSLTSELGSITAFAQGMNIGSANANQALTLRSDGAISVTGAATAGTNLLVSGITATNALSFVAGTAEAISGNVDVRATTTDITTTRAGQNVLVSGTTVTLGRVDAGLGGMTGAYSVNAAGAVTLGKAAGQRQSALDSVSITGASITEGAADLRLTSNSDDSGSGALALTSTTGSISLATTTLKGGNSQTSDISLNSANATTIDQAFSANFVSTSSAAFTANLVDAAGNAAITAGSVAAGKVDATGDITVRSDGAVQANTLAAGGNLTVRGNSISHAASLTAIGGTSGSIISATTGAITIRGGEINVASATSGGNTLMDAQLGVGTIALGSLNAGADAEIVAADNITLGRAGNNTQTARGRILVTSTTGSIFDGANSVTITSNDDGIGSERLQLSAGLDIVMGNTTLRGGLAKTSPVTLTAGRDITINQALSADFTATTSDSASFTANLIDAAGNAAITAGSVGATVVKATGDITITGTNAVEANTLAAGNNVTVKGPGANYAASLAAIGGINGTAITATTGAISVKAGAINVASATSGTSTTLDAQTAGGTIQVGAVGAGTNYTANATGDITLGPAGNQVQSAVGNMTITSTGGSISEGTTGSQFTSDSDGNGSGTLTFSAANGAIDLASSTLRGGPAKQAAIVVNSGLATTIGTASGLSFTATTGPTGDFQIGTLNTGTGAALINAGRAATIGNVTAEGNYTVTATGDVTLGLGDNARQLANGDISITSNGGSILASGDDLVVTSNNDGATGGTMLLDAKGMMSGAISLAGATLNGGTAAERTAVTLRAVGDIALANINSAALTVTARDFTSTGLIKAAGDTLFTLSGVGTINGIETTGAGSDITIGAASAVIGTAKSAGDYTITTSGTGGVTLGQTAGQTHSAAGSITITANGGGSISRGMGATNLTLSANSDGDSVGTMSLDAAVAAGGAGGIALSGATLNSGTSTGQRSAITMMADSGIEIANANSAAFTANAGSTFTSTGIITAAGPAAITAAGAAVVNRITTTGTGNGIAVVAQAATLGLVTSAADYTVTTTTGDITLGNAANQTQSAIGAIRMTTASGSIRQGSAVTGNAFTLLSNSMGTGTGALELTATGGQIALADTFLRGGPAQQSNVTLSAMGPVALKQVSSAGFTSQSTGAFTITGPIAAQGSVAITAVDGITLTNVTADGANGDITLVSNQAISADRLTAARNVTVSGPAAARAASFTAGTVTAGTGSVDVKAEAVDVTRAAAGLNVLVDGGTVMLGGVDAGGDYRVTADGDITLGKVGQLVQTAGGAVNLQSTGGQISQAASIAGITLTSNDAGTGTGSLDLNARGIALGGSTLNGGADKQSAVSVSAMGPVTVGKVNGASFDGGGFDGFTATGSISTTGNVRINSARAVNLEKVTASAPTSSIIVTTLGAVTADAISAGGLVQIGGGSGSPVSAFTAGTVSAGTGSVQVNAGASDIGAVSAGQNIAVEGTTAIIGSVMAGGDYAVSMIGDITLGKLMRQTQAAGGTVSISSRLGSVSEGTSAGGLTIMSDSAGAGSKALTITADDNIALGAATLNGGPAKQSAVTLTSGLATTVGAVNGQAVTATGLSITANRAVSSGSTVTLTTMGGNLNLVQGANAVGAISTTAFDTTAGGLIDGNTVTIQSSGNVQLDQGAKAVGAMAVNAANVASAGAVQAGTLDITASGDVALDRSVTTTGAARIAAVNATVGGAVQAGTFNVTATGNVLLDQSVTTAGATNITAVNTTIGGAVQAASLNITGTGSVTLDQGTKTTGAVTVSALNATFAGPVEASALTVTATKAANGTGIVTLRQGTKVANAVTVSAADATIGGVVDAKTIAVTNTGGGKLVIGGVAESEPTSTPRNFVLNRSEASLLRATDTLTLTSDAALGGNIEVRQVDFAVPKTTVIQGNGKRIDITGKVSFGSASTLKIGSANGSTPLILLNTGSTGGAASISSSGGVLELTAANIVAGTTAFATDLEAVSGAGSLTKAAAFNLNPGSSLYNNVTGNGSTLISAGSMKVTFSGFAMFQNTSNPQSLLFTGLELGNGNAQNIALDIQSTSSQPVFAMFGSINGVINTATALLGNPPLARYNNISSSRINGCVIGGGNCQSVQNFTPSLTGLDNIRATIFAVKPDFQVPFDPLVGTNNDSLFDDVGSFGLGELPMAPIECSDPNGTCEVQKKGGN